MGLSIGSDEFDSLALGDTPLEALMLGDVELWSAGGAPAALEPQTWGSSSEVTLAAGNTVMASYTAPVSGYISFVGSWNWVSWYSSYGSYTRTVEILVNSVRVKHWTWSDTSGGWTLSDQSHGPIPVQAGDLVQIRFYTNAASISGRKISSWSFTMTPVAPSTSYNYSEDLGTKSTGSNWVQVASHTIGNYVGGEVTVSASVIWSFTSASQGLQFRKNGTVIAQVLNSTGTPLTTTTTVASGDVITMWGRHTFADIEYSKFSNGTFSIVST